MRIQRFRYHMLTKRYVYNGFVRLVRRKLAYEHELAKRYVYNAFATIVAQNATYKVFLRHCKIVCDNALNSREVSQSALVCNDSCGKFEN